MKKISVKHVRQISIVKEDAQISLGVRRKPSIPVSALPQMDFFVRSRASTSSKKTAARLRRTQKAQSF